MPTLEFKGKQFVYSHHLSVPFRELKVETEKSLPPDGQRPSFDDNLIIHGDNLEALKALLPTHAGKIDCIFIDPPYNTGNEGWCYNDNVRSPLMKEWLKKSANPVDKEDLERHDKWLCMMWPRLWLLNDLLAPWGSIFITIDDNEAHHLGVLMNEVFGEENFVTSITLKTNPRGRQSDTHFATVNDYCVVYSKNIAYLELNGLPLSEEKITDYKSMDEGGQPWRELGLRQRGSASLREEREDMYFPIYVDSATGNISLTKDTKNHVEVRPKKSDGRDGRWMWSPKKVKEEISRVYGRVVEGTERYDVFIRDYMHRNGELKTEKPKTIWDESNINTELGGKLLTQIFGEKKFDYPKSIGLLTAILQIATHKKSIVLDSFAGSGTTAHAVLEANKKDGGNRRFILVECEDYADTLTAERMRRVIKGYAFTGTQRNELYQEKITWTAFAKKQREILKRIDGIELLEGKDYDNIRKEIKDGVLTVTGEHKIEEKMPGLGGSFTYCTLGEPINVESLLTGKGLPGFEALARYVFYTATGRSLEAVAKPSADGFVGETELFRIHLFYQPDTAWLRSNEAALNADRVEMIAKKNKTGKRAIVFAVAKFMSQKELTKQRIEFCQLPYAVHRILGD